MKNKKKMLLLGLIILVVLLIILVVRFEINHSRLNKIMKNSGENIHEYLGENFRIVTKSEGEVIWTTYYRNGIGMVRFENQDIIWENENEAYRIYYNETTYLQIEPMGIGRVNDDINGRNLGFNPAIRFSGQQYISRIDNFSRIIQREGQRVRIREYNGREYYVVITSVGDYNSEAWIDRETFLISRYWTGNSNETLVDMEFIIEINVVTEEDIRRPELESVTRI